MNQLTIKNNYQLKWIPDDLKQGFEELIMSAYFDDWYHDLHHIAYIVQDLSVWALEPTDDLFTYLNEGRPRKTEYLQLDTNQAMEDVSTVLEHFHMFYAWDDNGRLNQYLFDCIRHPFVREVW